MSHQAQSVKESDISGSATFAKGEEIRLILIEDYVTFTQKDVKSTKIDKNGNFSLSYLITQPSLVQLAIRNMRAEFYIVPQHTYQFEIQADSLLFQLLNPEDYGGYLQIKSTVIDTNDLNWKINRFSRYYEQQLAQYGSRIVRNREVLALDTLTQNIRAQFPIEYDPTNFYLTYIYYNIAQLQSIVMQKHADSIYRQYLDNEYLLYDNPAYMSFFNRFYENYLLTSKRIPKAALGEYINEQPNYSALFNEVGHDPLLVNAKIRELVIAKNLGEMYGNEDFDKKNVVYLLKYILDRTQYAENRVIITNIMTQLHHLESRSVMPTAHFIDENDKEVDFKKFKGKWIFLHFFDMNCPSCITEMLLLKDIYDKYKDSLMIVSVSLDMEKARFFKFLQSYKSQFAWTFLNFNKDYHWLNDMGVSSLPENMLLMPDGTLSQRYLPDISMNLSRFFLQKFGSEKELTNPYFEY
jgi:thiol-disulfide isomerase/thioredoxin